jgi:hypothetical protein
MDLDAQTDELFTYLDGKHIALTEFGCFVALSLGEDVIFVCPMLSDGSPEQCEADHQHMNWIEVTDPESEFMHKVNEVFGVSFDWRKFPGR